jgi:hypothetical protein
MKKLTPKAINEVLDLAFQKLPFDVYLVMCDVGEASLRTEITRKVGRKVKGKRVVRGKK